MRMLVVVGVDLLEGAVEVNRKGGKRSADGDLKYCGNFSSKDTHDTDSLSYDHALICS